SRRAIANNNKVGARLGDCVVAGCDLAPTRSADAIDDSLSVQDSNLGEGHQAARMQERCVGFATAEPEAFLKRPDFVKRHAVLSYSEERLGSVVDPANVAGLAKIPRLDTQTPALARIGAARSVMELVATSVRQRESVILLADPAQPVRQVEEFRGNEVNDVAFALDAPLRSDHARAEYHAAVLLVDVGPDDQIGHSSLILDGDEHDALR